MYLCHLPLVDRDREELPARPCRRGATAIEYLFMTSLIIVVLIVSIQQLGAVTKGMWTNNAAKTKVMDPSQQ